MHLKKIIFLRVTALLALMTMVIGAFYSFYTIQRHREMTKNLWMTRSLVLADAVRRLILWDDRVTSRQMLLNEVKNSDLLLYGFITKEGAPYVFTFDRGVPEALLDRKPLKTGQEIWEYQDLDGMVIYDIATSIDQGGTILRIGLKRSAIDWKMQPLLLSILMVSLITMLLSSYLALVVARRTTKEVDTLVEAMQTYGELNDNNLVLDATTSEVSELVKAFRELSASRKQAEMELGLMNARLEHLVNERTAQLMATNKELDAFAYSVSHDLRAPLRGVEGFSVALQEEYSDRLDDAGKDYLNRIRNGCVRMGKLIDGLLKLSRITRTEIQRVPVEIGDMARQVVAELQQIEPERKVRVDIDSTLVTFADPVLIGSVLENLLGNAWKFTRKTEDALISFGVNDEGVYFVRDNGAGFNMEYQNKLFGAFQRLHRVDEFEGTGIGLASVQRIILLHGGRIWAEGEEGKGAVFYFTLGKADS